MKIEYDKEVDAVYIYLQEKAVSKTIELTEGINIDLDENGRFIGVEILDATQRYSLFDVFNLSTENLVFDESVMGRHPESPHSSITDL
jgi:uncharacterized protein YuzE